jgi:hypothetical protein
MPKLGLGLGVSYIQRKLATTELVPEDPEIIWSFPTPPAGRTITGFLITTDPSGTILVDWGDDTSNTINSGSLVNKTY